jgi:hypothetical protein
MKPHTVNAQFNRRPARLALADRYVPRASWWCGATRQEWQTLVHARWQDQDQQEKALAPRTGSGAE